METCKDCNSFIALEENPEKGDCVQRVVDPRQAYYRARPVVADQDASHCSAFKKK